LFVSVRGYLEMEHTQMCRISIFCEVGIQLNGVVRYHMQLIREGIEFANDALEFFQHIPMLFFHLAMSAFMMGMRLSEYLELCSPNI